MTKQKPSHRKALRSAAAKKGWQTRRALSEAMERNRQHGPIMPSLKADHWWEQIESIGRAWNIPMTLSEWESSTKAMEAAA